VEVLAPSGEHVHAHAVLRELASLAIVRTDLSQSNGELFQRQVIDVAELGTAPNRWMAPMQVPMRRLGQ
jgi:hypothetical protein